MTITSDGFTFQRSLGGISEYTLEANGLTVLLLPDRSTPTATFMCTYRVGSRNETTGSIGATHLLEHLMFKGSERYNDSLGNSLNQYLETIGGNFNATTWLDRTNYYATVGSEFLEGYIAVESDRMRRLRLRDEDRRSEVTVVLDEFERGENQFGRKLQQEVYAAAYTAHPYHHPTIGWRSDIEKVSIARLREFYDTFYWPDNATVSVIGDIDPQPALGLIMKYYGGYPRAPRPIPVMHTEEPAQRGPRRVQLRRVGQSPLLLIAHKSPAATHPDYAPLFVFSAILAGGNGKSSRLYRALVDRNLATQVGAAAGFHRDPSLQVISVTLPGGGKLAEVETVVLSEIERIKTGGVTASEIQTAVAQLRARRAYDRDGSFALAGSLNECIAAGDWSLYLTLDEGIQQVTDAEVRRVAQTYLTDDCSTTGWFVPIRPSGG